MSGFAGPACCSRSPLPVRGSLPPRRGFERSTARPRQFRRRSSRATKQGGRRSAPSSSPSLSHSTESSTRGFTDESRQSVDSSSSFPMRVLRQPSGPRCGYCLTTKPCMSGGSSGTRPRRTSGSRTRCVATRFRSSTTTHSASRLTRSTTGAMAWSSKSTPSKGSSTRRSLTKATRTEIGIRSGMSGQVGSTGAGRWRCGSRSSRCATTQACRRSGAFT